MSKSYDDRIVRMGFDNAKFEKNASQTMGTLDKLNEKLKLKGATEGSNNIQRSIDAVNFASMERAIMSIERRFSTLGVVGMNVIGQITNGIIGSVKQLEAATIGQIKSGGWSRAMNIANAKFQIEGLGFAWEEVEKAVSYGVKDTAYGLDAAASAASQLAASGVDFKKTLDTVNGQDLTAMHKSLRAISGVAAMTNSSYEDIARIFTTVAGNGRLMGDQLLQLSSRGMNAAAKLAETLNTTEGEIRDMVSRGKIDFQTFAFAMDDAFGAHAKEANKTFTGALGNMKAALSRVGEIFASPIINKTNTLFISLTTRIDEFKNKLKSIKVPKTFEEIKKQYGDIVLSATAYDQMLKAADEKTITFGEHFAEMWQSGIDAFSKMVESVDIKWFDKIVEKVDSVTVKITDFFNLIKEVYSDSAEEAAEGINDATKTLLVSAEEAQAAKDIIYKGAYGNGQERMSALAKLFGDGKEGEQHAKNVQAYVDSVVAAGWDFEKASIKVEEAATTVGASHGKMAEEVKKARLKRTLDEVSDTFMNLWTVTKNLGKAAGKIVSSILTAFGKVFDINFDKITSGALTFSGTLVELSEKLIMSDDTAEKVTTIFTKFFTSVKNGITTLEKAGTAVWNFVKPISDTKIFQNAKTGLENLFDALSKDDNLSFFETIKEQIGEFVDSLTVEGVGKSIKDFFDGVFSAFETLELPKSIKDNELYKTITNFIDSIKLVFDEDTDIGTKISNFFNEIVKAVNNLDVIDTAKLAASVVGIVAVFRLFQAINSLSKLMESIALIPEKIASTIGKLGKMFENLGVAGLNASKILVFKAAATAILEVIGSLIIISAIPADDIYRATSVLVVVVGALALMMTLLKKSTGPKLNIKGSLISITAFSANLIAVASVILAAGGAIFLVVKAFTIINESVSKYGEEGFKQFGITMGLLIATLAGFIILGAALKKEYIKAESLLSTFIGMSAVMTAFGSAVLMISGAMYVMSMIPKDKFSSVQATLGLIALLIGALIFTSSISTPGQMLAATAAMVGISVALGLMAAVISAIALIPTNEDVLNSILTFVGIAIVMFTSVALISNVMTSNLSKIGTLIVGIIGIQLVMITLVGAIAAITAVATANPEAFKQATAAMTQILIVLGVAVLLMGIGVALSKAAGDNDGLFAVGAAFVMVAAGIFVLAVSIEKLAGVASKSMVAILVAVGVIGAFIGIMIGLAVATAFIPGFGLAFEAIGKTLLMAGAGFALVGAAVFLVCAGINLLAPAVKTLALNLEILFTVIENHWKTTLVVFAVFTVVVIAVTVAISKLAESFIFIVYALKVAMQTIGALLSAGGEKLKKWFSGLSTKGKTAIVAIITTLCAAILKASPQVLNTVGQLIIKLLAYLGSIAGTVAEGLLNFLINIINGLADAIRNNSNRIANALWNVVFSLVVLAIDILKELVYMLLGDTIGDKVNDLLGFDRVESKLSETILKRRKLAEEADQAKKDYQDSILGITDATAEASSKTGSLFSGITKMLKGETEEQKSAIESLKDEYADLPGYAYDAILKSQQTQNKTKDYRHAGGGGGSWDLDSIKSQFGGGGSNWDPSDPEGLGLISPEAMAQFGTDAGTTYTTAEGEAIAGGSDEIYRATTENTDSAQQAIIDSKDGTKKSVQENFNDPFQLQIRSGRGNSQMAVEYVVDGMIKAMDDKNESYAAAAVRLAKAGNRAFEKENQINSPSKLYYQNGAYIVQGLVNGIEQNTQNVESAVGDMSNAILVSFGNPIDYLSKITTGELEYDPSIRPVFDGSSIRTGADSINSMLRNQTVSVSGFSGKLAADISSLDHTNSDVVGELRALREEMGYMQEAISNMQIVMDTGALVGSTVDAYDEAFGRRAVYGRRGN